MKLHVVLPDNLSKDELSSWIARNAKETPVDTENRYYTEEEQHEFEKESSVHGRELARLAAVVKGVTALVKKGNQDSEKTTILVFLAEGEKVDIKQKENQNIITIPATIGTKELETQRSQNYAALEQGYEVDEIQLYGIPCFETGNMEFFDIDANHYPARSKGLSMKEKKEYFGLFRMNNHGENLKVVEEDVVDQATGELRPAVGE